MGGIGSGRYSGCGRTTVESCRNLDINLLKRRGCLWDGWSGSWEWKRDGEKVASILMRSNGDHLTLNYGFRAQGEEWEEVTVAIDIYYSPCTFGGSRPYFVCPGRACGNHVVKLYGAHKYFLCRHCYRLTYSSQNEERWDRRLRRANKIRMRLGGEPGTASPFPERPKGMWHRTYNRLRNEVYRAEMAADHEFETRYAHLLAGLHNRR